MAYYGAERALHEQPIAVIASNAIIAVIASVSGTLSPCGELHAGVGLSCLRGGIAGVHDVVE